MFLGTLPDETTPIPDDEIDLDEKRRVLF